MECRVALSYSGHGPVAGLSEHNNEDLIRSIKDKSFIKQADSLFISEECVCRLAFFVSSYSKFPNTCLFCDVYKLFTLHRNCQGSCLLARKMSV